MKKKRGRPPTKPPDLQAFKALMTPRAKETLRALSQIEGKHGYELLETAFWDFVQRLPEDKRQAAEAIAQMVVDSRAKVDE